MDLKFLKILYHDTDLPISLTGLCCGFEKGEWRHKQYSEFLFETHLLDFALKFSEYKNLDSNDAIKKIKKAAIILLQRMAHQIPFKPSPKVCEKK